MKVLQPETVLKMKSTAEVFQGIFQNFNHNSYLTKFAPMLLNIFVHSRLPNRSNSTIDTLDKGMKHVQS